MQSDRVNHKMQETELVIYWHRVRWCLACSQSISI